MEGHRPEVRMGLPFAITIICASFSLKQQLVSELLVHSKGRFPGYSFLPINSEEQMMKGKGRNRERGLTEGPHGCVLMFLHVFLMWLHFLAGSILSYTPQYLTSSCSPRPHLGH
jgi:hypothetical protein